MVTEALARILPTDVTITATETMTLDRYGDLFPRTDDAAEVAAAEAALLGQALARH